MPESITAQTIFSPVVENELSAASALMVLTDLYSSALTWKSGQMR